MAAEARFGFKHLVNLPPDLLDLGDYALLETVQHWREKFPEAQFTLIHDRSKMIERHKQRWEDILDPANPAATVGQDRRTIEFPLPVTGLKIDDSESFVELQIADLVAGAACEVMNAKVRQQHSDYAERLVASGLSEAGAGGIWPGTAIDPEELGTSGPALADSALHIGQLLTDHKRRRETGSP